MRAGRLQGSLETRDSAGFRRSEPAVGGSIGGTITPGGNAKTGHQGTEQRPLARGVEPEITRLMDDRGKLRMTLRAPGAG